MYKLGGDRMKIKYTGKAKHLPLFMRCLIATYSRDSLLKDIPPITCRD